MLKTVFSYGLALAAGAVLLQWLEYRIWVHDHWIEGYVGLTAAAFMALGVWVGSKLIRKRPPAAGFEPNTRAQNSLGISEREYEVLRLLAAGLSNKGIAGRLDVSPNTVKTHVARLFEKLNVSRRTEAILSARELGLIP